MINPSQIKAVFLDWDHTLWDMEANAKETLKELFQMHHFADLSPFRDVDFVKSYQKFNNTLWKQYESNLITKDFLRTERFRLAMEDMEIPKEKQPETLWQDFLSLCPEKKQLMPFAQELVSELSKNYPLVIITNGFAETQYRKIANSGLKDFFSGIIISEEKGFKKPMPQIFEMAAKSVGVKTTEGIMIGDTYETDILGALNTQMQAIHFVENSSKAPKYSIKTSSLRDVLPLLGS